MIKRDDLVKIGQFNKPHGIKGELSFAFVNDSFDESECNFLICELDGIFVPFILESCRFKSNSVAFVKLKGIDSEIQGKIFTNLDVYFPKEYIKEDVSSKNFTWDYFIGYTLQDQLVGKIGEISDIDETTINTLFVIKKEDQELLIPAAEDLILSIDDATKTLFVLLPEGIFDL